MHQFFQQILNSYLSPKEPEGLGELQHARGELRDFHVISTTKIGGVTAETRGVAPLEFIFETQH